MFSFLLSLTLGFSPVTLDQLPANRVEKIANEVIQNMTAQSNIPKPTLVVTRRPEPTPLGALNYSRGGCTMVINTNPDAWAQWGRFLTRNNESQWNEIIAASVAHEMGHCMQEGRQFASTYQIHNDTLNALRGTSSTGLTDPKLVFKQELFADAIAVLYAQQHFGSDAGSIIHNLIHARAKFGKQDPSHDTSRELTSLVSENDQPKQQETLAATAIRLLNSVN